MLFNHEVERSVIGALLQGELKYISQLEDNDFDDPVYKSIFVAVRAVHSDKQPVDVLTVSAELANDGKDFTVEMLEACRMVPTTANAGAYVKIVLDCSRRRKVFRALRQGAERIQNGMNDVDTVLQKVAEETRFGRVKGSGVSFADATMHTWELLNRAMKGESGALKYRIRKLDTMTGGMWSGQLIILAANTGAGKSAFAMEIATNSILDKKRVMVCSREMTVEQYTQRILARLSGVNLRDICDGTLNDSDLELLTEQLNRLAEFSGAFLTDTYTVEELRAVVAADTPDLLIVDYLQLMDTKQKTANETLRLGRISVAMKQIALDYNIPVLSLSQLSRQEGRIALMPQKKDLRGSGNIEQDADVIIFLHQPENESDPFIRNSDANLFQLCKNNDNQKRYIVINLSKQRQGQLGVFHMVFEPSIMRFTQVE